jgi:hypothetical protein
VTDAAEARPRGRRPYLWIGLGGAGVVIAVVALLSISRAGTERDYDDAVRDRFVAACTTDGAEPVRGTCVCLYDRIEQTIPFDRFEEVDASLASQVAASPGQRLDLPDDIDVLLQACLAEEN